jgi:hypothetical protein
MHLLFLRELRSAQSLRLMPLAPTFIHSLLAHRRGLDLHRK